jgi:hypothetical protein
MEASPLSSRLRAARGLLAANDSDPILTRRLDHSPRRSCYTFEIVKNIVLQLTLLFVVICSLALAEDASFRHVSVPDAKGRQAKAVLTFSDSHKAVEVTSAKRDAVTIPYGKIDNFSYEFTKKHHLASVGLLTRSKSHWLEIDYHDADLPKTFVLRMEKRDYISILDAIKAHTGKDAEILGNANKGIGKN